MMDMVLVLPLCQVCWSPPKQHWMWKGVTDAVIGKIVVKTAWCYLYFLIISWWRWQTNGLSLSTEESVIQKGGLIKSWVYLWWLKLTSSCFRICKRDTELILSSRDSPAFCCTFCKYVTSWYVSYVLKLLISDQSDNSDYMQLFEPIPHKKWPRVRLRLQAKWGGLSQIDSTSSQLSHGPLRLGFLQCHTEKHRDAVDTSPSFPSKMALARKLWLKICGKWKHQVARYGVYDIIWYYMNCMWIS